ncbi:PAS domain-containing sensor histidine kinase [Pelagerythrobacter rhizovicinus]|uniref:histidine kinase n=1 Tax=Pelagerythrobacter rhizovicinus TaxID=2268576 RepID=A0A4Q2KPH5_9SPHN|nr:PAS domain S-box protein [Pelagerythrobacter rhizovicinus]RXZ65512.1 PAS domain S-box protein [Pelagerythrobacter rhizovicinus]
MATNQILSPPRQLSEYEALMAAAPSVLEALPGAVYLCDAEGYLTRYNLEAETLWGRKPALDRQERFCGSHKLYLVDGTPLALEDCPMAEAVETGKGTRNGEVVIERPDGTKITALVNVRALRGPDGEVQGAINCIQDISERKALEEELVRKNRDLEDFFDNGAVGLHIVSGDGTILRANRAELDLLGYSADEYIGRSITDFHADAPVIDDILHRLSRGDQLDRHPARLRAKDGSIREVLITSNSRIEDGEFVNTRCFTIDVTDWRKAEQAQRESDERLAATHEAAPVGIAEVDEQGCYIRVNDALCSILGRTRDEVLSSSLVEITHPEDRARESQQYQSQVRGEIDSYASEKRAIRGDGSIIHLEVSSSSVRDAQGHFRFGVRIMQDVTERKRMQEELRANERRLSDLLQALPAAIYTTDAEGRITFYNQAAADLAGRTPELGVDEWCVTWKLYRPDGTPLPHEECPMAVALREERAVRGEEAIAERPDGSRTPFIPYPTPLRDADGRLIGAVNMLVDISDRKAAETRQKVLIDELNHRVKNTLATVQSLARQTSRHARDLHGFGETFEARLLALARAHDLLTARNWTSAPLEKLLDDIVAPYSGDRGRLRMNGPHVELDPRTALSMTMVLSELATNAAKYGALSGPDGVLSVDWDLSGDADGALELKWSECGGPSVRAPDRQGFGTRLIERCIRRDLGGRLDLRFAESGVECRIEVPLGVLAEDA